MVGAALLPLVADPASAATAVTGPDVASWQHQGGAAINWNKVADDGRSFAIIKATEGTTYTNSYYAGDESGARAAGLAVGAYHFARPALPLSTATDQAKYFANVIGDVGRTGTLPPVLDLEQSGGLSAGKLILWTQQFLETVRSRTGRTPMVYSYPSFLTSTLAHTDAFTRYPLWLASYQSATPTSPTGWPAWTLWQYTSSGTVAGIQGDTDISRFRGDASALASFADGTISQPWAVTAPSPPEAVRATATNGEVTVSWLPADDGGDRASSFTVTASPGGQSVTAKGGAVATSVTGLAPGTSYTFTVTATNSAGTSPPSLPSNSVGGTAPDKPSGLTATGGPGQVTLTWTEPAGQPTSYRVYRCSPAPCTPSAPEIATIEAPTTSYTDAAVTPGTAYAYSVAARNDYGGSGKSAPVTATPGPATLAQPTGLTAAGGTGEVSLSWGPVDGAEGYHVYRCTGDGCPPSGAPVATVAAPDTSVTDDVAGGTYTYAVTAFSAGATSPPSDPVVATALAPTRLTAAASPQVVTAGDASTVTFHLTRTDTGAGLADTAVVVTSRSADGSTSTELVTDDTGTATMTVRTALTQTVTGTVSSTEETGAADASAKVAVVPRLTAKLKRPTIHRGHHTRLHGHTRTAYAGEHVVVQHRAHGHWHRVGTAVVAADGHYHLVVAPTKRAVHKFRVVLRHSPSHRRGVSNVARLSVI